MQALVSLSPQPMRFQRTAPAVRFGSQSAGDSGDWVEFSEMMAASFRRAYKDAESLREGSVMKLLRVLMGGDRAFIKKLIKELQTLLEKEPAEYSCRFETQPDGSKACRVIADTTNKLFKNRHVYSSDTLTFSQFLAKRFGSEPRVIISITGWTKPPIDYFLKHKDFAPILEKMPEEKQAETVDELYQNAIKEFLSDVIKQLTEEDPDFNCHTDLGIIYGVTYKGIDRAVQEFCTDRSIDLAGLTCFDWAEDIADEAGWPDVYLAKDTTEFSSMMETNCNLLFLTGGRAFAAGMNHNADVNKIVPLDLMSSYLNVEIPGSVPAADKMSAQVLNAAKFYKGEHPESDYWESKLIQQARNGRKINNRDAFVAIHLLKRKIESIRRMREIHHAK